MSDETPTVDELRAMREQADEMRRHFGRHARIDVFLTLFNMTTAVGNLVLFRMWGSAFSAVVGVFGIVCAFVCWRFAMYASHWRDRAAYAVGLFDKTIERLGEQ